MLVLYAEQKEHGMRSESWGGASLIHFISPGLPNNMWVFDLSLRKGTPGQQLGEKDGVAAMHSKQKQ